MLARIRKSIEDKDQGFTLIELLVVMIIIGILAAIAIPVFLSQRNKARDTATKSDVSTIGKTLASYYTDGVGAPGLTITGNSGAVTGGGAAIETVKVSDGTVLSKIGTVGTGAAADTWCVALKNSTTNKVFQYSAAGGLEAVASGTGC